MLLDKNGERIKATIPPPPPPLDTNTAYYWKGAGPPYDPADTWWKRLWNWLFVYY